MRLPCAPAQLCPQCAGRRSAAFDSRLPADAVALWRLVRRGKWWELPSCRSHCFHGHILSSRSDDTVTSSCCRLLLVDRRGEGGEASGRRHDGWRSTCRPRGSGQCRAAFTTRTERGVRCRPTRDCGVEGAEEANDRALPLHGCWLREAELPTQVYCAEGATNRTARHATPHLLHTVAPTTRKKRERISVTVYITTASSSGRGEGLELQR